MEYHITVGLLFAAWATLVLTIKRLAHHVRGTGEVNISLIWLIIVIAPSAFLPFKEAMFILIGTSVSLTLAIQTRKWFLPLTNTMGIAVTTVEYLPFFLMLTALVIHYASLEIEGSIVVGILFSFIYMMLTAPFKPLLNVPQFNMHFPKMTRARERLAERSDFDSVCVHLPSYSEPPEVVKMSIDAIANNLGRQSHLLVIDNNTKDEQIWQPLEAHCEVKGESVSFRHVEGITGAKAGALNYALRQSPSHTEFIAVVDADYIVESAYFEEYQKLFTDPDISYVQLSHDYHSYEDNVFLAGSYYTYTPYPKMVLPALDEYDAGLSIGTMCLFRHDVITEIGGWGEWCLTEDSELTIRMGLAGYKGNVLGDTAGRGLLPETFEAVKKQIFRWAAGPTQQLLHHWRGYLSALTRGQMKWNTFILIMRTHLHRFAIPLNMLIVVLAITVFPAWAESDIPFSILVSSIIFSAARVALLYGDKWITFQMMGGVRVKDFLNSILIENALRWTNMCGFLAPLVKISLPWNRTEKFPKARESGRMLRSVATELKVGIFFVALTMGGLINYYDELPNLITLAGMAGLWTATTFLGAGWAAYLSEKSLPKNL
ncbi:hypothetical protein PSCICN_43640 [Pseudomonas cichorii]|uniref:glycosyltransferase n=1 Tax=Pseudomonas cichorii TaxID=36746 RepID=UPI0019112489|nr:glycosyltransferase [Pseudomonas cichorii]GFM83672.1 hypothetical protein PSCICN_43640 [Pseudomonas cichorii]